MPTALVLGAGMVGSVMAADLLTTRGWKVTVADARRESLEQCVERCRRGAGKEKSRAPIALLEDLSAPHTITALAAKHDVVLGALSSHLAFDALRAVIEAKKPYADIAFMPEDATELSTFAKRRGVTAIVDMGVAPGMSNLLAGSVAASLSPCERIDIMVGGLPVQRLAPFQYKAGFSPADVIEEYTRPARQVEHGRVVVKEALSECELVDLPGVGTVEAFNTDGLRSLAATLGGVRRGSGTGIPNIRERTLRWPGHVELMLAFRAAGYFSKEPIAVSAADGTITHIAPLAMTAALLFPKWTFGEDEPDLTVMRVIGEGRLARKERVRLIWDLFDVRDATTGFTSMSRTTAFPCAIVARLLASGALKRPGVIPPELLATEPGVLDTLLREHARRGIAYSLRVEELDSEE